MKNQPVDLAIVGAGAAGLMTAIAAARQSGASIRILLIDSKTKPGAKILMSGGTRCNVTNETVQPADFEGGPKHFVKHVFEAFTPNKTIDFFKTIGVELILESTGKYFPATHSAQAVLGALLKEVKRLEVQLITGIKITDVQKVDDGFILKGTNREFSAKKIVITTGGLSHPGTGSDGAGYVMAQRFGHRIIQTYPGLTPLLTEDSQWKLLSGVSLEAELSFYQSGKKQCNRRGSLLFTHFGFSGPAALDISRHFAASEKQSRPEIKVNFLPGQNEESFKKMWERAQANSADKTVKNFLIQEFQLPGRFVETFLDKINLDASVPLRTHSKEKFRLLTQSLFYYPLEISGVYGYQKAEVTAGGVDLQEIKVQTMESKLVRGLYFAGEILDVDGRIGGFNFQWAWSTGMIAGRGAARGLAS